MTEARENTANPYQMQRIRRRLRSIDTLTLPIRRLLDESHSNRPDSLTALMEAYFEPICDEIEAYLRAHPKPWLVAAGIKDAATELALEFIEKRVMDPATPGQMIFSEALEKVTPEGWVEPMKFRDKLIMALRQFVEKEALKLLRRPGLAGNGRNIEINSLDGGDEEVTGQAPRAAEPCAEMLMPGAAFALKLKLDLAVEAIDSLRTVEQKRVEAVQQLLAVEADDANVASLARMANWRPRDLVAAMKNAHMWLLGQSLLAVDAAARTQWGVSHLKRWGQVLRCAAKANTTPQKEVAAALGLSPAQMAQEVNDLMTRFRKAVLELGRRRGLSPEELEEVVSHRPPLQEDEN